MQLYQPTNLIMWVELLLTGISSFIVSGGLTTLVCMRFMRKKASNEADQGAVDVMQDTLNEVKLLLERYLELYERDEKTIEDKNKEILELSTDKSVCGQYICGRCSCFCRLPNRSQGHQFIEDFKTGKAQVDFRPLEEVVKEYGYTLKKDDTTTR